MTKRTRYEVRAYRKGFAIFHIMSNKAIYWTPRHCHALRQYNRYYSEA
jgi:hypothetical protein